MNDSEDPINGNDHAVDALRYAVVTHVPAGVIRDEGVDLNLYNHDYS